MRLTLFFAIVTTALNMAGLPQCAEVAHLAASTFALTFGSRAITDAVRAPRRDTTPAPALSV